MYVVRSHTELKTLQEKNDISK